eukprot:123381-Pyramimonas_sp.AAC.2
MDHICLTCVHPGQDEGALLVCRHARQNLSSSPRSRAKRHNLAVSRVSDRTVTCTVTVLWLYCDCTVTVLCAPLGPHLAPIPQPRRLQGERLYCDCTVTVL